MFSMYVPAEYVHSCICSFVCMSPSCVWRPFLCTSPPYTYRLHVCSLRMSPGCMSSLCVCPLYKHVSFVCTCSLCVWSLQVYSPFVGYICPLHLRTPRYVYSTKCILRRMYSYIMSPLAQSCLWRCGSWQHCDLMVCKLSDLITMPKENYLQDRNVVRALHWKKGCRRVVDLIDWH